jgi:phytoene synthase
MVDRSQLEQSKAIHKRTGTTFYFATRLLPERVRRATYVLYAFFRVADEVVDGDVGLSPEQQRERLEEIREQALGRGDGDDPVLSAFAEFREEAGIDSEEVEVFIDAMLTDIRKERYETYDELEAYMRGSAAAVGEMMTAVMDPEEYDQARPPARALGEAFQLTNFLRDVGEDIEDRGRIYLPLSSMAEHGVTEEQIQHREVDEEFRSLMEAELRRAEGLYRKGVAGIKFLPSDCQFAVLLAAVLYADHHRLIRERNYDVLTETPQLSTLRKSYLVVKTRAYWLFNKDPEAVFAKVSAVPAATDRRREPGHSDPHPVQ